MSAYLLLHSHALSKGFTLQRNELIIFTTDSSQLLPPTLPDLMLFHLRDVENDADLINKSSVSLSIFVD